MLRSIRHLRTPLVRRCIALGVTLALLAPTAVLVAPQDAHAQPKAKPLREQLSEAARKHFDAGVALAQRGKWDGARTSFNAAYDASKNPRVLYNVAIAERELGRYAQAIETFRRELAEGKGQLTADEEAQVRGVIAGLEKYVAQLTIVVNEPGADVFVDGDRVGTSPLAKPLTVPLGERRVKATKPGFADASESIQLPGGGSATVTLKMLSSERTSLARISVLGPPTAVLKVDGKEVGQSSGSEPYKIQVRVSQEPHVFSAEANGWTVATQTVTVGEGETPVITLKSDPEQKKGKLLVIARPEGATIEIDGKTVGSSRWEGPVDAKIHQIVVRKQGYYTWSYDVDVPRGGERSVTASLNEDRNTSFVPWLIGTVVVIGVGATAGYFLFKPKDQDPVPGTLPPFALGTQSYRSP